MKMESLLVVLETLLVAGALVLSVLSIWPWAFMCVALAIWIEVGS